MAALTVTFGELLGLNDRQPVVNNNNVRVNDNLAERLEAERRRRIDAIDAENNRLAEINRRKEAAKARRNAIAQRDMLIAELHKNTVVRTKKDGSRYMAAKPGKANLVRFIRYNLEPIAKQCRPNNGYPCPPPRRSPLYPKGGAWKHRPGNPLAQLQGEYSRLSQYVRTLCDHDDRMIEKGEASVMYDAKGNPRRALRNMLAHCARLERKIDLLFKVKTTCLNCGNETKNGKTYCSMVCRGNATSETNVRRRPGTKYYRAVVDAR